MGDGRLEGGGVWWKEQREGGMEETVLSRGGQGPPICPRPPVPVPPPRCEREDATSRPLKSSGSHKSGVGEQVGIADPPALCPHLLGGVSPLQRGPPKCPSALCNPTLLSTGKAAPGNGGAASTPNPLLAPHALAAARDVAPSLGTRWGSPLWAQSWGSRPTRNGVGGSPARGAAPGPLLGGIRELGIGVHPSTGTGGTAGGWGWPPNNCAIIRPRPGGLN